MTEGGEEQRVLSPWVSLPSHKERLISKDNGLTYLQSIKCIYVYRNIQIIDKVFDSPKMTRNCMTVRNNVFQQIYYIGIDGNRRPGKILPFTLRVIDQYNKLVVLIKKYLTLCFSQQIIDVEYPPGLVVAKIVRNKNKKDDQLFFIYGTNSELKFIITRKEEKKNKNEFKVLTEKREKMASISKRYEKIVAVDKTVIYEDHYNRITFEDFKEIHVLDKAIILCGALIVDIFFMTKL